MITIATPHRGSNMSNDATQWLGRELISLPKALVQNEQRLRRDNPELFEKSALIDVTTSIDSLSPRSPILPAMLAAPRAPWVTYHNIVGRLPHRDLLGRVTGDGDGVVPYASAHLDDVASEIEVPADHSDVHRHPLSVLEVRRILLEQLAELRRNPAGPPRVMAAAGRRPPEFRRRNSSAARRRIDGRRLAPPRSLLPALRSPLSALRSPLSALRSPLSSPLSALRSPLSALRSPLSALRSPLSALRSPLSALRSLPSPLICAICYA